MNAAKKLTAKEELQKWHEVRDLVREAIELLDSVSNPAAVRDDLAKAIATAVAECRRIEGGQR